MRPSALALMFLLLPAAAAAQALDLEAQLNSLSADLGTAQARLQQICQGADALPKCQTWALELASKLQETSPAEAIEAVAGALGVLVKLGHETGSFTEGAATVAFIYGSMESDRGHWPQGEEGLTDAVRIFEKVRGPKDARNVEALAKLGEFYTVRKVFSKAEPLLLRSLDLLKVSDPDHTGTPYVMNDLGELYDAMGDYAKAESCLRQAVKLREETLGPDDPRLAVSLSNLADIEETNRQYDEAERNYRRALNILQKADPDGFQTSCVRNNLAELYHTLEEFGKAEALYTEILPHLEKRGDSPELAAILGNLASVYVDEGALDKAEPLYLRSLEIRKRVLGADHPDTALGAYNAGTLYFRKGDYRKAEEYYRRALEIRESKLPKDHPDIGINLDSLAQALEYQGAYAQAEPLYLRALAIDEKAEPDSPETATVLSNLGTLHQTLGEYAKAEPMLLQALKIRKKVLPPNHRLIGISDTALALLYASQGAYAKAAALDRDALSISEKVYGPRHRETAVSVINLAEVYRQQRNYTAAEPLYLRGLKVMEEVLPQGHPDIAIAKTDLGMMYSAAGAYSKAEPLFLEAMEAQRNTSSADPTSIARTEHNLATVYYGQKDYAKAEPLFAESLATLDRILGPAHPDTLSARIDRARDLWLLSRRAEARDQLIAANRALTSFWSQTLTAVEGERRRTLASEFDDLLALSMTIAGELSAEDRAGATLLASLAIDARKGIRSSAAQEVFARIRSDRNPEALALFRQLLENAEQQGIASRKSDSRARQELEQLRHQEGEIEKQLIDRSSAYRQWRTPVEPSQIAAALPTQSAFIDVIRYPRIDLATGRPRDFRYAALVYPSRQQPQLVLLGPAGIVEKAVLDLRANFRNMWQVFCPPPGPCLNGGRRTLIGGEPFQVNLHATEADCALLYRLTVAKFRLALAGATSLIVSPDAALAEVPWEILRNREGPEGRYLVQAGYRVRYLDSARTLVYPSPPAVPMSRAVVLAQVDYNGTSRPADAVSTSLAGFPWMAVETPAGESARSGAPVWKPLAGGSEILRTLRRLQQAGRIGPVEKLPLGSEEEVVALNRPAALIAHTHGFFQASETGSASVRESLDSGIVLYGANRAGQRNRQGMDGWLTAKEAMLLNLDGTQLVALLGCETGRGIEAGEGVQGLRHALTVAGARSTLLTLWEVGDLSAARFLGELLTRSAPDTHNTLGEALAKTQLAFLRGEVRETNSTVSSNRWQHPYFWAAATLAGHDGVLNFDVPK